MYIEQNIYIYKTIFYKKSKYFTKRILGNLEPAEIFLK